MKKIKQNVVEQSSTNVNIGSGMNIPANTKVSVGSTVVSNGFTVSSTLKTPLFNEDNDSSDSETDEMSSDVNICVKMLNNPTLGKGSTFKMGNVNISGVSKKSMSYASSPLVKFPPPPMPLPHRKLLSKASDLFDKLYPEDNKDEASVLSTRQELNRLKTLAQSPSKPLKAHDVEFLNDLIGNLEKLTNVNDNKAGLK